MKRDDVEKLDDPTWRSAYESALGRAEAVGRSGDDVLIFAAVSADLVLEQVEAELARAAAHMSTSAHSAEPAEADDFDVNVELSPDADADWRRAVSRINAQNGRHFETDNDQVETTSEGGPARHLAETGAKGWAKATSNINQRR